jgi:hypothetical protein
MAEIGITMREFTRELSDIGRGAEHIILQPLPSNSSTYPSAVKPDDLIKELNDMIELYHRFLKRDTDRAKMLGQQLVDADAALAGHS